MWQVQGQFAVEEPGTWEGTHYEYTAYRTTMTLWANPSHDSRVSELEYQLNEVQDANSKLQKEVNHISSHLESASQASSQPLAYAGFGIALMALVLVGWIMISQKRK